MKEVQAEYRGVVDEATKVVFQWCGIGLHPTGSSEAQKRTLSREMR